MTLPVDPDRYLAFLAVMAVMAATPGPANLFSVANGMARGPLAAFLGVLGMSAATLFGEYPSRSPSNWNCADKPSKTCWPIPNGHCPRPCAT